MNTQRAPLYVAHRSSPAVAGESTERPSLIPYSSSSEPTPEEAAQYIADLLCTLRAMAIKAEFDILSDLIEVAQEEAKLHCREEIRPVLSAV